MTLDHISHNTNEDGLGVVIIKVMSYIIMVWVVIVKNPKKEGTKCDFRQ